MRNGRRNGAAALVPALLLMACSGGGGDDAAETSPAASAAETTAAQAATDAPTTAPATTVATTTTAPPVAVDAPCPTGGPSRCGTVTVPLDRADPDAGTIDIFFSLTPAPSQPAQGTMFGLAGGPGPATLTNGPGAWVDWAQAAGPYDVVLTDYRGTGRSGALYCATTQDGPFPSEIEGARTAIAACGAEVADRAASFDTVATADDLEAVRTALGIGPVDLFGISHGTYVAQVYASRYPEAVRSVTLDGAIPVAGAKTDAGIDYFSIIQLRAAVTALQTICSRSSGACSPDQVLADLGAVAELLRSAPPAGVPDMTVLARMLLEPSTQPALPGALRAAASGDLPRLEQLAAPFIAPPAAGAGPVGGYSAALAASIACNDFAGEYDAPDRQARAEQVAAEIAALPADLLAPFTADEWARVVDVTNGYRSLCVGWPGPGSATADEHAQPLPAVPVLVINGDLDIVTPLQGAEQTAQEWPGAVLVTVPNAGHTTIVSGPCATTVLGEFVRTLTVADVNACATSVPPVAPAT